MDGWQALLLIGIVACAISFGLGWLTKSYIWPALWSVVVILVPGPTFLASLAAGLLAAYVVRNRKADTMKEVV